MSKAIIYVCKVLDSVRKGFNIRKKSSNDKEQREQEEEWYLSVRFLNHENLKYRGK